MLSLTTIKIAYLLEKNSDHFERISSFHAHPFAQAQYAVLLLA